MSSDVTVSARIREIYDSTYQGESAWRSLGAIGKVRNIVDLCSSIPHDKILEIGSGEGAILQRLSDLNFGKDLYSIEISESAVATIQRRNVRNLRDCRLFDGYHTSYRDGQFDVAVMSHVLEHAEYPRILLCEAARVANYLFIEIPLEDTIRLKPDFVLDSVGHINFYSWKTIRRLVQTCNLQILSQKVTNPSRAMYKYHSGRTGILKYTVKELLLRTSQRLAAGLFTYHCAILCSTGSAGDLHCPK